MAELAAKIRADLDRFAQQAERNVRDAATLIKAELQRTVSVPYPPASRRGEPPARRTGRLEESAYAEVDTSNLTIEFGYGSPYWRYLAPTRPAIEPTLTRINQQLESLLLDRGYREALNG